MNNPYFANAAVYLIDTVFSVYMLLVMLRFLLQVVRADFYNPICRFIVKATNPPLRPLRRVIPGVGGIDLASVILLLVLQVVALKLSHLAVGQTVKFPGLMVMACGELLSLALTCFTITIIAQAILSWFGPGGAYHPITRLLYSLNEPLLRPVRRIIPPIGGTLDLSPLLVIFVLQLAKILLVQPISDLGRVLGYN